MGDEQFPGGAVLDARSDVPAKKTPLSSMRQRIASRLFGTEPEPEEVIAGKRIVECVASGASGDVYVARDEVLDRTLAIKVLRTPGESDESELRRLHREARTLARLAHPNVVHVYEVGVDAGRLYIAMEYVPGMSLAQWQRSGRRSVSEIVRCYGEAARGLAAAHVVGVIHRDVKPANILLGDDGRVRVVDFGLARTIEDDGEGSAGSPSPSPRRGSSPWQLATESRYTCGGTPAYMAPETLRQGLTGPHSDQFSWAVSLHEALYDKRPFDRRSARDDDPLSPLGLRSACGEAVPTWLRDVIRRALAPDVHSRFASMDEVVDTLALEPRRATLRRLSLAGVGGLFAVVGATWLVAAPPRPCSDPRDPLVGVWDDATRSEVASAFARTGLDFAPTTVAYATGRLDAYAQDWTAVRREACEATNVRGDRSQEALDLANACLADRRERLADVTTLFASADARTIAHVDDVLGVLPEVRDCNEVAFLREDGISGHAGDPEVIEARRLVAAASLALRRGDPAAARDAVEWAIDEARRLGVPGVAAEALMVGAEDHARRGDSQEAITMLLDAVDEAERGRHDVLKPSVWLELARVTGDLAEDGPTARQHVNRAEAALARLGREPTSDAEWLEASAMAEGASGAREEAEARARRAVEFRRTDPEGELALAQALALLAYWLAPDSREEARSLYGEAIELRSATLGSSHPSVAELEFNVGVLAYEEGELDTAKQTFEHALRKLAAGRGADAPVLSKVHVALADLANAEGRHDAAVSEATRALALQGATLGLEPSVKSAAHRALANAYRELGRDAEALAATLDALALDTGRRAEIELVAERVNAGFFLCGLGRCAEAQPHYQKVADALVDVHDPDARKVYAYAMSGLGKVYLSLHAPAPALASFEVARGVAEREMTELDHPLLGEAHFGMAQAFRLLSVPELAREHAEIARQGYGRSGDLYARDLAEVEAFLADRRDRSR